MKKSAITYAGIVVGVFLLADCGLAVAETINISLTNGDFESPLQTSGATHVKVKTGFDSSTNDVPGWANDGSTYTDSGVDWGGTPSYGTKYGTNTSELAFLSKNDSPAIQMTNHIIANGDKFTITFSSMNGFYSSGNSQGKCALYYLDGSTKVALGYVQTDRNTTYADNYWSTVSKTVDATAASVGKTLGIQIRATNGWAFYDNFNLTCETVPEPTSVAMLVTGVLGLIAYAWRKRK